MILSEDKLFLEAYAAVSACPQVRLAGEEYKRPKFPDAKPAYQSWLNRKELGVDFGENNDFAPVLDGSFVGPMVGTMRSSRRCTVSPRREGTRGAAHREALNEVCCA